MRDTVSTRELILQPLLAATQARITDQALASAEWSTYVEHEMQSMMLKLRKYVLSERLAGDVEVPVLIPVVYRTTSRWLRRKREHRFTVYARVTIPVASYNTFPEAQIRYPKDLGQPVRLQMWEGESA